MALAGGTFSLCLRFIARRRTQNIQSGRAVSYPHLEPFLGLDLLILTIWRMLTHTHIAAVAERHRKYGCTFTINQFGNTTFHTSNPHNIRTAFDTASQDWHVGPARLRAMEPLCGRGFLTSDGENWAMYRNMLRPLFTKSNVDDLSAFSKFVDELLITLPRDGTTIDLAPVIDDFVRRKHLCCYLDSTNRWNKFLDLSGHWLLGDRFSALRRDEGQASENPPEISSSRFLEALHAAEFWVGIRVTFGWLGLHLATQYFRNHCKYVHSFLAPYIHQALSMQNTKNDNTSSLGMDSSSRSRGSGTRDLLRALTQHSAEIDVVRAQLLQTMITSQETISTLLCNAVFLLSRHPDVWKTLRERVVRDRGTGFTADALRNMTFVQNIIKECMNHALSFEIFANIIEALRLYPVFGQLGRTAVRDTILPKGGGATGEDPIFAQKGDRIIASFFALHRDQETFGVDADTFRPSRWQTIKCGTWEYLPFLEGPRRCPAQDLVFLQVSYCLVRLALHVERIESRDNRPWAGEWRLTLKNAHGCKVALYAK